MLQELIYTSAPAGLKPGSQGFCTVACTTGMPPNLAKLLETISSYRHVFMPPHPNAGQNPVSCSHLLLSLGGVPWHILSHTADSGLDFTQRVNNISHHLVFDKAEQHEAGPAAVLTQFPFLASWNQKPVILPANKKLPTISSQTQGCDQWSVLTGDAGWGGVLAETALSKRPVSIIFRPGMDMLPLVGEAMALLPPELRWQITFSTYCCNLPNGTGCQWKCILASSPEMAQVRHTANTLVIDLTQPLGAPPDGSLVEAARTGKPPEKLERIIPLSIQGGNQVVYGIQDAGIPTQVGTPPVAPTTPAQVQPKPAKSAKSVQDKKKSNDDVSSKGCFWLIIVFFILVTAGMIFGLLRFYGKNISYEGNVTVQGKEIEKLNTTIDTLNQQIENDKSKYQQMDDERAKWQDAKNDYVKLLSDKDVYINRVADYFSLFPPVKFLPVSVNVKDDIPRKDGDLDPLKALLDFNGTLDRTWNVKDMFSVNVTCSNEKMACQLSSPATIFPLGNEVLLSFPWRLYAQKANDVGEPIAEFELVVTEKGIAVRRFNDDQWNKFVEEKLTELYDTEMKAKQSGALDSAVDNKLIAWYENNVKDAAFALDEAMLKTIDELDAKIFAGKYADVARLIELRKDYFGGRISLEFVVDVKLEYLTDMVKRGKP